MTDSPSRLAEQLSKRFGDSLQNVTVAVGEVTVEVAPRTCLPWPPRCVTSRHSPSKY